MNYERDQGILLLSFLAASKTNLKEIMMYAWESLTLEELQYVLHSRTLQNKLKLKTDNGKG